MPRPRVVRLRLGCAQVGLPTKIGFSEDLGPRLLLVASAVRQPITIVAVMRGRPRDERLLHDRYAHARVGTPHRGRGACGGTEWFWTTDDMLALLAERSHEGVALIRDDVVLREQEPEFFASQHV